IQSAKDFFFLDPGIEVHCKDARDFLNRSDEHYDVILVDIFKAEEQPNHVLTLESLHRLKEKNMTRSSRMFINWHGYTDSQLGKGTAILKRTLDSAGFHTVMYSLSKDQNHRNIIFECQDASTVKANDQMYSGLILHDELPDTKIVNTDDRPVLEKYNATANKTWRTNYLRYYQNK
ncbi:MAG: hypothetical protein K0S12_1735, partial [Bacteroidetes bacterium]|nr:hypothetical protein [Bacteroidota bacterium]